MKLKFEMQILNPLKSKKFSVVSFYIRSKNKSLQLNIISAYVIENGIKNRMFEAYILYKG